MEPITISSINDLIKWNSTLSKDKNEVRFLFRGVTDEKYELKPKLYRDIKQGSAEIIKARIRRRVNLLEDYLKIHLPAYGYDFHGLSEKGRLWREIFLAQHYGAATNLLDFTRNPMVAAYFAAKNSKNKKNGKIYAIRIQEQDWYSNRKFDPHELSYNIASYDLLSEKRKIDKKNFNGWSPYELKRPIFVVPPILDKRIQAQIGLFCCLPINEKTSLIDYPEFKVENKNEPGFIQEFIIESNNKVNILDELNKTGVNHMSLFPDMNGFGEFVSWKLMNDKIS